MIQVVCSNENYTYDAYHLVKAFYPSKEVKSLVDEKASPFVTVLLEDGKEVTVDAADIGFTEKEALELEKSVRKNLIGKVLYSRLSAVTGRELAWGILTGVRPTKIAMQKLEEGMTGEEFVPWFMEDCLVSRQKAALSWEIVNREKALLDRLDYRDGYSLYVGIPFCPTVCSYCSFSSGAIGDWKSSVEPYIDALCKELAFIGEAQPDKKLNTIYMGGGTPTTLRPEQLDRVLTCIDENFSMADLLEYTVEAGRPDSITEEKLQVLKDHGITRISINPQSMQQKTLDAIGRKHTVQDIRDAYALARSMGFDNINMDLIAGLPGETPEDMQDTLRQIRKMDPDNLTVHSLAIKRAAKMGQKQREKLKTEDAGTSAAEEADLDRTSGDMTRMIADAAACARDMGMTPYYLYRQKNMAGNFENVGYAKVDKAGIYNILIMEEKQSIIAAGAGGSTKLVLTEPAEGAEDGKDRTNIVRIENVKAIDAYIARIDEMIERKGEWLWR